MRHKRLKRKSLIILSTLVLTLSSVSATPSAARKKDNFSLTVSVLHRMLVRSVLNARYITVYGGDSMWHGDTRLSTDADAPEKDDASVWNVALVMRDRRLFREVLPALRLTSTAATCPRAALPSERNNITIDFSAAPPKDGDLGAILKTPGDVKVTFFRRRQTYYAEVLGLSSPPHSLYGAFTIMEARSGARLEAFVQGTAKRARGHGSGVSYFHYNIYSLNPS